MPTVDKASQQTPMIAVAPTMLAIVELDGRQTRLACLGAGCA